MGQCEHLHRENNKLAEGHRVLIQSNETLTRRIDEQRKANEAFATENAELRLTKEATDKELFEANKLGREQAAQIRALKASLEAAAIPRRGLNLFGGNR